MKGMEQLLSDVHIVTSSLTVAAELERLGIPFSDELSYLEPDEIAHNLNLAYNLTDHWWNERQADTEFLGFSLAQAARQEWVMPFELCLNASIAYRRLFNAKSVHHIYGFFLPPIAVCRTGPAPAFRPAASVTQAVLLWLAHDAGITVTSLKTSHPLSAEGRQWRPRLTADDLKQSASLESDFVSATLRFSRKSERVVLLWKEGLWAQEIAGLERGFARFPGWKLIKLTARELRLGETMGQDCTRDEIEQKLDHAWRVYESSVGGYSGQYPEIFGNPYLRFQFARIFAEMRTAARLGLSFANIVDLLQPSLVVFGHEAFTIERTLVQVAHRKGIPTVALIHGGLQPMYGRLGIVGDADYVMVWGQRDVQELTRFGVTRDRLRQVGSLRFDEQYQCVELPLGCDLDTSKKIAARKDLKLPAQQPVILLLTAPTNVELSQPAANPVIHRKTWRELVVLAKRRSDLTFAIKPHPAYDFIDFYRYLCNHGPRNLALLKPVSLEVALRASDVAVLVNYCSTAGMEAILLNVPVVFIRPAVYPTEMHKDPLEEHGAILASSIAELEVAIDRLLGDATFRRQQLASAQHLLRSLLGERGQPAVNRMIAELDRIALPKTDGRPAVMPDLEKSVKHQLATATRCLWESDDHCQFLSEVPELVSSLRTTMGQDADLLKRVMFGLAFAMGHAASDIEEFRNMVRVCFAEFSSQLGVSVGLRNKMVLRAYLVAIMRNVDAGRWNTARSLVFYALMGVPGQAVRLRMFWEFLVRALIGSNRLALFVVKVIDRLWAISAKVSLPRYIDVKSWQ